MLKKTVALCMACATLGMAQNYDEYQFVEGTKEFIISGSGASDKNLNNTTASVQMSYGYFVRDNWELSLRQEVGVADNPDGSDWSGSTRLAFDYHFDLNRLQPFIGVTIGGVYGDSVKSQFIAGPEAGLKFFVKQDAFLFGMVEYQFLFRDKDEADEAFKDGRYVYSVGMGFTW